MHGNPAGSHAPDNAIVEKEVGEAAGGHYNFVQSIDFVEDQTLYIAMEHIIALLVR
ncbi:hypothetical protein PC129_g607 [Phytophthora cactorum]|uniref:Uncharacterized protein n=1 Tax=Phytophthora cactorum TaxID=29920 RepID=A0A8T1IXI8_9STRA|nr:hypothetical protein PC129_g607 [Phytophthora cactorum]